MSLSPEEIDGIINKLRDASNPAIENLDPDEVAELRRMLKAWSTWKAMGMIGKLLIWGLVTIAGLIVAYNQIIEGVGKWLKG